MADYLSKRGANIAPSYAAIADLPASTQAGDLVFVGGQLGIAVDASTFNTCDKTDVVFLPDFNATYITGSRLVNPEPIQSDFLGSIIFAGGNGNSASTKKRFGSMSGNSYYHARLYVWEIDTATKAITVLRRLTKPPNMTVNNPQFEYQGMMSPNGRYVAAAGYQGYQKLYIYDIDSSSSSVNATPTGVECSPVSPCTSYYYGHWCACGDTYSAAGSRGATSDNWNGAVNVFQNSNGSHVRSFTSAYSGTNLQWGFNGSNIYNDRWMFVSGYHGDNQVTLCDISNGNKYAVPIPSGASGYFGKRYSGMFIQEKYAVIIDERATTSTAGIGKAHIYDTTAFPTLTLLRTIEAPNEANNIYSWGSDAGGNGEMVSISDNGSLFVPGVYHSASGGSWTDGGAFWVYNCVDGSLLQGPIYPRTVITTADLSPIGAGSITDDGNKRMGGRGRILSLTNSADIVIIGSHLFRGATGAGSNTTTTTGTGALYVFD